MMKKEGKQEKKESFYTKDNKLKEMLLIFNNLDSSLPSVVSSLLQEFRNVIPEDGPNGLPPEETKDLQSQEHELISPCVTHVLLEPKKDGLLCIFIFMPSTTL